MNALVHQVINLPAFVITWCTFFAAGIISFLIQLYRNRQILSLSAFVRHCFPFDFWSAKSVHMDVKIYLIRKATDSLLAAPALASTAAIATFISHLLSWLSPKYVPTHPTSLILTGCCAVVFLFNEFSDFLLHYLAHRTPVLWEFHKIHHSALMLNPLTSKRGHSLPILYEGPVGGAFSGIAAGVFAFLFGLSLTDVVLLGAIGSKIGTLVTLDPLKHSHFPVGLGWLEGIFISPHMHQVHHSSLVPHLDKNFGTNLSIFDWMFGTAYRPSKDESIAYGLNGYDETAIKRYDTLAGVYVGPMISAWKVLGLNGRTRRVSFGTNEERA
jgi:sterol desaturase/sphingolipid hydroxylase (fatty acid hydroxylase superfamily)